MHYFWIGLISFEIHNIHVIEARYEAENALIEAVCNCNEDAAVEALTKFHAYLLPQRLPDRLRDMKNYTITFNTLLRKAAERAGVPPMEHMLTFRPAKSNKEL